jgi:hypothetical protein
MQPNSQQDARDNPNTTTHTTLKIETQHINPSSSHPTQHTTNILHENKNQPTHPNANKKTAQTKKQTAPNAKHGTGKNITHPSPQNKKGTFKTQKEKASKVFGSRFKIKNQIQNSIKLVLGIRSRKGSRVPSHPLVNGAIFVYYTLKS